jgi:succinate-semialdehyde dehydrogenase/glutarate-semialdehyde dehydrogenase
MAEVTSINPYNNKRLETFELLSNSEIERVLQSSQKSYLSWKKTTLSERKTYLSAVANDLRENKKAYANTITSEMGKPMAQAIAEVEKCAWVCDYYAQSAAEHLAPETVATDASKSYITYEPLGVLLAVMPWNYPFWQVFRFAAPALMAGNVVLLKHASNVFGSALLIEKVFERAGLPSGVFKTLLIETKQVKSIIENPIVKAVTLTGSEAAGSAVASTAGAQIKKTVLELGGSNALIVFEDADVDKTIDICVQARFQNTGQSCIAGKRLLIAASIAEEFLEKLVAKVKKLKSGDPADSDVYIGVMAREDLAEELEKQLKDSLKQGAKLLLGGKRKGTYFEPTVVIDVTQDMVIFKEETFGPLLAVSTFTTEEEALQLSNNSPFGLGVSLFSNDIERMESYVPRLEEGAVFINSLVKSDPRLPFGGIKSSGYGRELSKEGIREFVNVKTVFIA